MQRETCDSRHVPSTQMLSAAHRMPHSPQLLGSREVSVQLSTHRDGKPSQSVPHAPARHTSHGMSQPPQCAGSSCGSTQRSPQRIMPGRHKHASPSQTSVSGSQRPAHASLTHAPSRHSWPRTHGSLQAPQCCRDTMTSTHSTPHRSPREQGSTHAPAAHSCRAEHVTPQAPQFSGSSRGSMHAPSHCSSGPAQPSAGTT